MTTYIVIACYGNGADSWRTNVAVFSAQEKAYAYSKKYDALMKKIMERLKEVNEKIDSRISTLPDYLFDQWEKYNDYEEYNSCIVEKIKYFE